MQATTDMQFKVGDKAVYPAQGVAEVIDIEEKDIGGSRQQFYVLRILDTDRKIMVPVKNANAVGLRQVISEQEIQEIFDILRERTVAFDNQTWNRRYRGFMDKIKTGSIYDVAEVLRDLYRLKTDKQLSFGERRMLDTARTLIVKSPGLCSTMPRRRAQLTGVQSRSGAPQSSRLPRPQGTQAVPCRCSSRTSSCSSLASGLITARWCHATGGACGPGRP